MSNVVYLDEYKAKIASDPTKKLGFTPAKDYFDSEWKDDPFTQGYCSGYSKAANTNPFTEGTEAHDQYERGYVAGSNDQKTGAI